MRLNPDCVRDVLLAVEERTDFYMYFDSDDAEHSSFLKEYNEEEILYHMRQCAFAGLVSVVKGGDYTRISDLTPQGHSFLADIRSDNIWSKTKTISSKVGSASLDVLTKISSAVIAELIKKHVP